MEEDEHKEHETCEHCHHRHEGHSHEEHEHHHEHEEGERPLLKIIIAAVLFVCALLCEYVEPLKMKDGFINKIVYMVLYFAAYLICGKDVIKEAVEHIFKGNVFSEEFLMALATIVAIFLGEYSEAVAVMILFELGEFLEDKAVDSSRDAITALVDIRPETAVIKKDGKEVTLPAQEVAVGSILVVRPGERIPLDGIVQSGTSLVDTSALTGESVPRTVEPGETVLAGFVNTSSTLEIKTTRAFSESQVSRVLELVEHAQSKKASAQKFISRFARIYTPVVCALALIIAVVPPLVLFAAHGAVTKDVWHNWIYRALMLLVISCPCALVISVPLSFFAGIGVSGKRGILVKGAHYIELLAKTKTLVLDKTGTLTQGIFAVKEVRCAEKSPVSKEELLALATHAEYYSLHPISKSLKEAHTCPACGTLDSSCVQEISGHGISCVIDKKRVLVGNERLMQKEQVTEFVPCTAQESGTIVYVAVDSVFCGSIIISDSLKENAIDALKQARAAGVKKIVMLTGDRKESATAVFEAVNVGGHGEPGGRSGRVIDQVVSDLLPQDKVSALENLLPNGTVAFVGDGINDAPVLSRSDVGIAMGALGSDAAIEAADVVIMDDNLEKIGEAIRLSKKTMRIVRQNVVFSLGVKTLIMILCICNVGNMWLAVFGDVGVAMLAVLNATRQLFVVKRKTERTL